MRQLRYSLGWAVASCLVLALLLTPVAADPIGVTVSIDAPAEATYCTNITARVNIANVTDMDTYQFKLSYDPTILEVIGPEMGPQGVTNGLIDTTTVPVDMWAFSPIGTPGTLYILGNVGGVLGVSGDGYLCEVHFHVIGSACNTSALTLSEGKMWTGAMQPIPVTEWLGDSVHVAAGVVVTDCMADPNPTKVGYNTNFSANATGGTPPYSWQWDFGDGTGSSLESPVHQYTTANIYTVTVNVTDFAATEGTCSFNITVNPALAVSDCMADPNPTKVGHNTIFSANATGGVGTYTWYWDFGDGNNSSAASPIYAYAAANNYTVTVNVTDDLGNEKDCSFNITVQEELNVTDCMADPNPTKVGHNTTFSVNVTEGVPPYTYDWDFGDGNNSSEASPVYAYTTADNYTVTVNVTDDVGNEKDCSFNITVNEALNVTDCAADPNPTRVGYNTTFSANVTGGIGAYTYDWDFGDGNSSAQVSPVYAYATANTYNVTLNVTDAYANMKSCSFDLVVNPPLNVTGCMADPNPTRVGYNTTFTVNITGGLPPYFYDWDFGDGNSSAQASPVHQYAAVGSYNVTINVTDSIADEDSCAFPITVNPPLYVTDCKADPNPTKVGYNTTFSANATGGVGTLTWDWEFGDGNSSAEVSPVYAYAAADNYSVTVTVTDDVGQESCSFNISVNEALAVNFSADSGIVRAYPDPFVDPMLAYPTSGYVAGTVITTNTTFNFTNESTGGVGPYSYDWDFGDGNNSTDENPVYTYTVNATYNVSLTVTDSLANVETETKPDYIMAYRAGDANHNSVIDMADVTKVEREILRIDSPTIWADANNDHAINMADVTTIEWIILLS